MTKHTHTCADCQYVWDCMVWLDSPQRKTCVVDDAVKSNKPVENGKIAKKGIGPFCEMCRNIRGAEAAALRRGIKLAILREI